MNGYPCPVCGEWHQRYGVMLPAPLLALLAVALRANGGQPLQVLTPPVPLTRLHHRRTAGTCARGHPWTPASTYRNGKKRHRACRICRKLRQRLGSAAALDAELDAELDLC